MYILWRTKKSFGRVAGFARSKRESQGRHSKLCLVWLIRCCGAKTACRDLLFFRMRAFLRCFPPKTSCWMKITTTIENRMFCGSKNNSPCVSATGVAHDGAYTCDGNTDFYTQVSVLNGLSHKRTNQCHWGDIYIVEIKKKALEYRVVVGIPEPHQNGDSPHPKTSCWLNHNHHLPCAHPQWKRRFRYTKISVLNGKPRRTCLVSLGELRPV